MAGIVATPVCFAAPSSAAAASSAVGRPSVGTLPAWKACITETVRVTGFAIARGERRLALPQSGYRISEVLVKEGDTVTANQDLVRATPVDVNAGGPAAGGSSGAAAVTLRAPAAGLVTQLAAVVGDMTGNTAFPGQPLVTITIGSGVDLIVDVPSPFAARVRKGAGARVRGLGEVDAGGTVKEPVSTVDPATQVGQARVAVDAASSLKPGQFGSARIEIARECRVTIPQAAVTLRDGVASVQVLNGTVLERRTVLTGLSNDTDVQVREGLSEGEVVVASAGSGVEPVAAGEPGKAPEPPPR